MNDCIEWKGSRKGHNYGRVHLNKKRIYAHRAAYEIHYGKFDDNLWVLHKCDNTFCINPLHLFLGSPKDNSQDMIQKGRQYIGNHKGIHNGKAKLNDHSVKMIRQFIFQKIPMAAIAKEYRLSRWSIYRIKNKETWSHI